MKEQQESLPGVPAPRAGEWTTEQESGEPRLKRVDRRQLVMRAMDVDKLVAEDDPVRAIWEFVGQLDLSRYTEQVRSVSGVAGRPALDPQVLVSLWVYSYSRGESSARAIARQCDYEPGYQWLTGMEPVSAHTLSDFRVAHAESLRDLFVQTLGLLSEQGLITLERVMQDGTKVRANASGSSFRTKNRVEAFLEQAREAVEELESKSEEESSLQMQAARRRAEREKRQRLSRALEQYEKLEAAKSRIKHASTTDPDARFMKHAEGNSAPSYNVQVTTDAEHSVIVDIEATQAGSDYRQLKPAMDRVEQNLARTPKQVVVDGGYISNENISAMAKRGVELIGPDPETKKRSQANRKKSYSHRSVSPEYEGSNFVYDAATNTYICPEGKRLRYEAKYERSGAMHYRYMASKQDCHSCPAKSQCCPRTRGGRAVERIGPSADVAQFRQRMATDEAKAIYRTRSQIAEFPNLWIKSKFGIRQFNVRGLAKVRTESLWAALTYDIMQWIRLCWRPALVPP